MSSATVLFILARMLEDPTLNDGARAVGVAFGPGLTVESALITARVPAAALPEELAARHPEPVAAG